MKSASNWASRPHQPRGSDKAVHMSKSIATGMTQPESERMTRVDLTKGGPGKVHTPGWFSSKR
jgi:hypothetical protein